MTDQSNTPFTTGPDHSGNEPEDGSLFERAHKTFDLRGFKPAPVPRELANTPTKRLRPQPEAAYAASPTVEQVVPAPTSEPVSKPVPAAIAAPTPVPEEPITAPSADPVRFTGAKHPIDRGHLREQGLIVPEGAVTALLEEFRIVKRQLLEAARLSLSGRGPANGQRVLICSPHPGEGKTFCAINLALAIASEKDSEVLLVDADFAKPSVLSVLGLSGGPGFMDALANPSIRVEDCVLATDVPGLYVLPAGNQSNDDSEYLASSRTARLLDRLTQGAPNRMVIFDSPPALAASPAAELAKYVGQAVLVARADRTGQSALEDAYSLLSACPDIKLLLNAAHFSPSGRRFGSYYGYGE